MDICTGRVRSIPVSLGVSSRLPLESRWKTSDTATITIRRKSKTKDGRGLLQGARGPMPSGMYQDARWYQRKKRKRRTTYKEK